MVNTIITAMAAYSNERVAAIILSVLYRMLTKHSPIPKRVIGALSITTKRQVEQLYLALDFTVKR